MTVADSPLRNVELHEIESLDDVMEFKRWLGERREVMGCDTESAGLNPRLDPIRLVQFGDLRHGWAIRTDRWSGLAHEVFRTYEGAYVFHNSPYDGRVLRHHLGIELPWHRVEDTLTMARLEDPLRPAGLKPLSKILIGPEAVAGQRAMEEGMALRGWTWATIPYEFKPYIVYSALDPVLTCHMYEQLKPKMVGHNREPYELEVGVIPVIVRMMDAGMRVDRAYVAEQQEIRVTYAKEVRRWLEANWQVTNPMSSLQVMRALERELPDWTPTKLTAGGAPSMDKEVLAGLREMGSTVADAVLRVRQAEKVAGTYLENVLKYADENDILHAQINPNQAKSGRMSIEQPSMQNFPRDDPAPRGSFIPREDHVFLTFDADQEEMRLAAHFAGDEVLAEDFREADRTGVDFFTTLARKLWGPEVTKKDPRRQRIKNVGYAYNYGAKAPKMALTAGVSVAEIQPVVDAFESRYLKLKQYIPGLIAACREQIRNGERPYVETPTGRRLPVDPQKLFVAANQQIQGHAAEILKRNLINLDAAGLGHILRLPIHDEILTEPRRDELEDAKTTMRDVLNDPDGYLAPITWGGDVLEERWRKT